MRVPMNHGQCPDINVVGTLLATDADVHRRCRVPLLAGREFSPMMASCQDGMWVMSTISSGTARGSRGNHAATTRGSWWKPGWSTRPVSGYLLVKAVARERA